MQAAGAVQNSPGHLRASPSPNRARRELQPKANTAKSVTPLYGHSSDLAS